MLGDRFGASCDAKLTRFMRDVLQGAGYDVQVNRPYAGGFITEHYGNPARGVQSLQLEINRGLYLDEANLVQEQGLPEAGAHPHGHGGEGLRGAAVAARAAGGGRMTAASDRLGSPSRYIASQYGGELGQRRRRP